MYLAQIQGYDSHFEDTSELNDSSGIKPAHGHLSLAILFGCNSEHMLQLVQGDGQRIQGNSEIFGQKHQGYASWATPELPVSGIYWYSNPCFFQYVCSGS